MIRTTADWVKELARSKRGTPMHTAVSEVVRLRKELETVREEYGFRLIAVEEAYNDTNSEFAMAQLEYRAMDCQEFATNLGHILEGKNND